MARMRRRAFTLVEILVVIGIIALLAALLFPVFTRARAAARRAACISNLRQIGMAVRIYRQEQGGLPLHLSSLYPDYVKDACLFICPSDSQAGQHEGNDWLEGNLYLASGVSYDYVPNWEVAQDLGWWQPAPRYGRGKWEELTPLARCNWHWATYFSEEMPGNASDASGWVLVLTAGGSVHKIRSEMAPAEFTPDKYQ